MKHWIVGGSKGIGLAIAERLIETSEAEIVRCFSRSGDAPMGCISHVLDLRKSIEPQLTSILRDYGPPDTLTLSAGLGRYHRMDKWTEEDFQDLIQVNLVGPIVVARQVALAMRKARSGHILFIGSSISNHGANALELYAATKAGLKGYVTSNCRHLAKKGVTVMLLEPGWTKSQMVEGIIPELQEAIIRNIPIGRMLHTEEVAKVAIDMLSWPIAAAGTIVQLTGGA